jgi:hypothetical protein
MATNDAGTIGIIVQRNGTTYNVKRSTDALTWNSTVFTTTSAITSLNFGGGAFVLVGNDGAIFRSTNGSSFSAVTPPILGNFSNLQFVNGMFIARSTVAGDGFIVSTDNGASFTFVDRNSFAHTSVPYAYEITYDGVSKYYAAQGSQHYSTTDLTTGEWTLWNFTAAPDTSYSQGGNYFNNASVLTRLGGDITTPNLPKKSTGYGTELTTIRQIVAS